MKQKNRSYKKQKIIKIGTLLPGYILFILLPVCGLVREVKTDLGKYSWFPDGEIQYDFFLKAKSELLLILAVWMLGILIWKRIIKREKMVFDRRSYLLLLYLGMAILSTCFSVDLKTAVWGIWDGDEGALVLLSYVIICFYFWQMAGEEKNRRCFLYALMTGGTLQAVIGIGQLFQCDFWQSSVGKWFLTFGQGESFKESLIYYFDKSTRNPVYMGSYNPNYAGVYCLLLIPIVIGLFLIEKRFRIAYAALAGGLIICLFGSGSKTSIGIASLMLLIVLFFLIKKKRILVLCAVLVLGIFTGYDLTHQHALLKEVRQLLKNYHYTLKEVNPQEDGVYIRVKNARYRLVNVHDSYGDTLEINKITDKGDVIEIPVEWDRENQCFCALDNEFPTLTFDAYQKNGTDYLYIFYMMDDGWCFIRNEETDGYCYLNKYGKPDEFVTAKAVFTGHERIFTGRGYIWGRTIPLLDQYLLTGSGPDTFLLIFPQQDYLAKGLARNQLLRNLVSKPHNIFLQIWVQTGLISLLLLLLFVGLYMVKTIKEIRIFDRSNPKGLPPQVHRQRIMKTVLLFSVAGFWAAGICNDSCVATSPILWGILGIGLSL